MRSSSGEAAYLVLGPVQTTGKDCPILPAYFAVTRHAVSGDSGLVKASSDHAAESGCENLRDRIRLADPFFRALLLHRIAALGSPERWQDSNLFSDYRAPWECCRAPHNSHVQRNKRRWNAGFFTSTFLSYSRAREFSLPARLAAGKKKCVDVPRCDTASRADWQ